MLKNFTIGLVKLLFILTFFYPIAAFAQTGNIKGIIRDAQTKEALPYSNVIIVDKSLGAASDKDGNYIIRNVPVGTYTLRATFVGYNQKEAKVEIQKDKTVEYNFNLDPVTLQGETVTVTAQAEGQYQAINEQLNSLSIKNVVSAARIQELPDNNAAESVGRLPGVSLIREGGEGSKVVIRGLSPQYNQVTIDGVELASDVASANNVVSTDQNQQDATQSLLGDRGMDLSMISSNMLGGIEVIKAITPDMDAAVLGGVVNFDMRKASIGSGLENGFLPKFSLVLQGGYNALKDTKNDYKFIGTLEKRFSNDAFGVFVYGSAEKRNLSANNLGADYTFEEVNKGDSGLPYLSALNLSDVYRIRDRYGATVVLDYHHSTGDIGLMNVFSNSVTNATTRSERAQLSSGLVNEQLHYGILDEEEHLSVISNILSVKQDIPFFHINMKLAYSFSETKDPGNNSFDFVQQRAGLDNQRALRIAPPVNIANAIRYNDSTAFLWTINNQKTLSDERLLSGSLDLEHDFVFSDWLAANLKFGGMYQYRKRVYNFDIKNGSVIYDNGSIVTGQFGQSYPWLYFNGNGLSLANFVVSNQYVTNDYSYGEFLNGDYKLGYPLNADLMNQLAPIALSTSSTNIIGGGYQLNQLGSKLNDYSGHELKDAAYVMANIKLGDQISILPGARYQNLTTEYTAVSGTITQNNFLPPLDANGVRRPSIYRTKKVSHDYVLPMVHLNYKPFEWFQAHFAYTNTLNYPDYSAITPRFLIGRNFIQYNNYRLKPATSENYDLVLSVFSNEIGLLSVDGFYKRIKDLIFYSHTYIHDPAILNDPEVTAAAGIIYSLTTYINSPFPVDVKGLETDWQTHFWYLPQPFSGLILNINYTHIFSEASYPKSIHRVRVSEEGVVLEDRYIDTLYTTRLLNQPNDILNLAVGYDYKDFSARISMLYHDNIFKQPDFYSQLRIISDKYTRWDLSVKQRLPWFGIQVYFNLNNITGENDVDLNPRTSFPANEDRYGTYGELGLNISL